VPGECIWADCGGTGIDLFNIFEVNSEAHVRDLLNTGAKVQNPVDYLGQLRGGGLGKRGDPSNKNFTGMRRRDNQQSSEKDGWGVGRANEIQRI